ncbi:MAG: DUF1449 family protein [Bacteroidetes Order II. Incertae sedis bacterium]|nr:DUF1449 family protein [Bacteroidetes Order II. bacterium]
MDVFFQPARLIFTIPLMLAFSLWVISAMGIGGGHDSDVDSTTDFHLDADHGWVDTGLHLLGFGLVPLSLVVTWILFGFGLSGLVLHATLGAYLPSDWLPNIVFIPLALVIGLIMSSVLSRLLKPLFKDYGVAATERDLIGKVATVKSNQASATFGAASLRLENGNEIEIAIRTENPNIALSYGTRVLLTGKLPGKEVFEVTPFDA